MQPHSIVSRDEWVAARRSLLEKEKAHMRQGDAIAAERRALPWVKVDKRYVFDDYRWPQDAGRTVRWPKPKLIVHHLMYAPEWEAACPGCSFQAEHIDGPAPHLNHHDVRIVAVSRTPLAKLLAYKARMGWRFDWVSSLGGDFNYDFRVSFTKDQVAAGRIDYNFGTIQIDPRYVDEELPGVSVFLRNDAGEIFHTYSTYARGLDFLLGANHYLDITPEGRNDAAHPNWPRRHDEYEQPGGACCESNEG